MIAFLIWSFVGFCFAGMGIYCLTAKKPVGFWANAEVFQVSDLKKYNRAMAKFWFVFGAVFILLGLPLLDGQNSPLVIVTILGVMFEAIGAMIFYTLVIEKKYRMNKQGR